MADVNEMSRTMRIDLIPDVPTQPVKDKRRVVVPSRSESDLKPQSEARSDHESGSSYEELFESIYDAAVITDLSGKVLEVNARAVEFLRWSKAELEGVSVSDIISGADASLIDTLYENLEHQRFTLIQAYCIRKDGSFFPSEIAVNRLRADKNGLCFFVRDITLRRQAEEMLRTEHNAIQNAANGIAIANLDGVLEYVNPAFGVMMDNTLPDDLMGIAIADLFEGTRIVEEMTEAVMGEAGRWSGEISAEMPSGAVIDLEILATCNRNSDGEIVGIVFSFTDLSDRKRAEAATREAERQRVMLESLGAACHHLGQPATVLMANLSLIQSKIDQSDPMLAQLLKGSMSAMERLGDTLHKLNKVNEYRTTVYMPGEDGDESKESRILDI